MLFPVMHILSNLQYIPDIMLLAGGCLTHSYCCVGICWQTVNFSNS